VPSASASPKVEPTPTVIARMRALRDGRGSANGAEGAEVVGRVVDFIKQMGPEIVAAHDRPGAARRQVLADEKIAVFQTIAFPLMQKRAVGNLEEADRLGSAGVRSGPT